MNLIISTGRVGMVDARTTKTGTPVTSVSVAMNERWTGKDGKPVEKTTWIRFTFWDKLAEIAKTILNKGDLVTLTGKIETPSTYKNRDGEYVAALEATGSSIEKLSKKDEHGTSQPTSEPQRTADVPAGEMEAEAGTIPMGSNGAPF